MLVKCTRSLHEQLSAGKVYLVLEVYTHLDRKTIDYRLLDNNGCPAIYSADYFEIESDRVSCFSLLVKETYLVLWPEIIAKSPLNAENIDGFWGCYFEDYQKWGQAKETLERAVQALAAQEDAGTFQLPPIADGWEGVLHLPDGQT